MDESIGISLLFISRVPKKTYYTICVMSVELCRWVCFVCFFENICVILKQNLGKKGKTMLGSRIAALRRGAGMSQADLAQKLKISPSAVGMYEQSRREPSVEILAQIAQVFGVSIDFLVTGKTASQQEQEAITQLLLQRVDLADGQLSARRVRPFSRQELAVLFAAMLMEP